jgi:putative tryptophan/tyrosine transport system substrate-binding protein
VTARRAFIVLAGATLAVVACDAFAQWPNDVRRIGILTAGNASDVAAVLSERLGELGWVEGRNLIIERRGASGKVEQIPTLAEELVMMRVEVIVSAGAVASLAAKKATAAIPIVAGSGDPVRLGLVASLAHPGGNITGVSMISPELSGKRIELLRELFPKKVRIGELVDPANQYARLTRPDYESDFRAHGFQPIFVDVAGADDLERAVGEISRLGAEAFIVRGDPLFVANSERIGRLALKHALPTMGEYREFPSGGGLLSYGPSNRAAIRQAASLVDKILRGAQPADLPIEQPTKFELVINMNTAKALGLTIPQALLMRADDVIR